MNCLGGYFGGLVTLCCMLIGFQIETKAQELSKDQIEQTSREHFYHKKYAEAIPGLEKLIDIYPNEEAYNYYLGVCYLQENISLERSINYLRYAASRNYIPDVHYFLAEAYYKNYMFEDAEIALINFLNIAKRKQIKKLKPSKLMQSIKQMRDEAFMVPDINIVTTESLKLEELEGVYALHLKGKFMRKEEGFMLKYDKDSDYQGYMYVPDTSENGYKLYFPARGKNGLDIYETTQITYQHYSLPKGLSAINSEANEEYPFYDNRTNTLFFSSDRIGGLGGYDIYKSQFISETGKFSEPERLEFPLNSPFDDILYVPGMTGESAIFLSNRNGEIAEYVAYKMQLNEESNFKFPKSVDEVRAVASLPLKTALSSDPIKIENLSPSMKPKIVLPYERLLQDAMEKQLKCDSMKADLVIHKNTLRTEIDENERRILFSKIATLEINLKMQQQEADSIFAAASGIKGAEPTNNLGTNFVEQKNNRTENSTNSKSTIELSREVSGIKQFSYTEIPENTQSDIDTVEKTSIKPLSSNTFAILDYPAYSDSNPIPIGESLPEGLVYRIQLGAFSQNLPMDSFGGLIPLTAEEIKERKLVKYYVGIFNQARNAREALLKVKDYGYDDAFIVSYFNNEKITIQKARELEFGEKNTIR